MYSLIIWKRRITSACLSFPLRWLTTALSWTTNAIWRTTKNALTLPAPFRLACRKPFCGIALKRIPRLRNIIWVQKGVCFVKCPKRSWNWLSQRKKGTAFIEQPTATRVRVVGWFFYDLLYDTAARVDWTFECAHMRRESRRHRYIFFRQERKFAAVVPPSSRRWHYTNILSEFHPDENWEYSRIICSTVFGAWTRNVPPTCGLLDRIRTRSKKSAALKYRKMFILIYST